MNLDKINQPILIVHSLKDKSVPSRNADIIFDGVSSEIKNILIVKNSGHVVTRDVDRSLIFEEIITHFKSQIK
jgi:carboxylesterase